ncbi:carbon-monoxide dehydrogenase large subunit [Rhizobiales bacterium GAS188]|nr:carbon-monoxide dehydrogenase large subunit [Rhizobiales bacterium GAS188]
MLAAQRQAKRKQVKADDVEPSQGKLAEDGFIGRSLRRLEDARLVTGAGCFVDDLEPAGCLHLEFLRSPYARGLIERLEMGAAREAPGVIGVFTAADLGPVGEASVNPLVPNLRLPPFNLLAKGSVEAVGQPVAAVIATSPAAARDALGLIELDISPTELRSGSAEDEAFSQGWHSGDIGAAFAAAACIAKVRVAHARVAPMPLEPRAALASWDHDRQELTARLSTQTPHRARDDLARILNLPESQIRVIAPDVGGAFGGRASIFPEDAMVALAAMRLGRPVKWRAARGDDLAAATHGRGATTEGELAVAADGRLIGLRARLVFPLGHWLPYSAAVPARNAGRILPGPYRIDAVDIGIKGVLSNTAAVGIYRGAGRPEGAMLMERLMDEAARLTGIDPVELRRRNLITGPFPYATPTGELLDSGDYPTLLHKACERARYHSLRREQQRRRAAGEICGLGVALYIEPCGHGWESATVSLAADGRIVAATGSTAQGQGRETAITQIAADTLGVALETIVVKHGDTAATRSGIGALASRSTAIGGSAMLRAAQAFREEARKIAAEMLQCPPERLAPIPEGFVMLDRSGRSLSWAALAEGTIGTARIDGRESHAVSTSVVYHADGEAWSSGCCIASLTIDRDTGVPKIDKLVFVDDAGVVVNPMMVEGQLVGGMAQGFGEALMERIVYDESGQLVTGSLMDYAVPRASDVPAVELDKLETPSPANALGAKGVGEAGCIGIPAAIANAVMDALQEFCIGEFGIGEFGIRDLAMPLTNETIWTAMQAGSGRKIGRDTP